MKKLLNTITEKLSALQERREKKPPAKKKAAAQTSRKTAEKVQRVEIDIPTMTVVKVLFIIFIFFAISELFVILQSILVITAICGFLALGLTPIVHALEQHNIPRPLAILILYIGFVGALGVLFFAIVPILAEQLFMIARDLRDFFAQDHSEIPILHDVLVALQFDAKEVQQFISSNLTSISRNLQSVAGSTFTILTDVFQGVFNFIFALVLMFFILMEREHIGKFILALIPMRDKDYIRKKTITIQNKMSDWFRGQVILMVSVGTAMYIGMKVLEHTLGMQYAATIGLLAGFMELFPYIGVIITGLLAGIIAVNISWVLLVAVVAWMALIQFLEGNLLVPLVMEKATGLSSAVVMLSLAMGGVLGNAVGGVPLAILGMILAIPTAASIGIFVEEYAKKKY